jgi:PadR family transcriptional regulator PadR
MTPKKQDLIPGTLDLLVLRSLASEPMHGWGIAKRIEQASDEVLKVNQGSLYPALHRLQDRGWIRSKLGLSAEGRPVKVYTLTAAGRKQLARESESWELLSGAVNRVLKLA